MCFILLLPPKGVIFIFTLLSRHWLPLWYLVWYLATPPFCVETEQSRTRHTGPVESNPTPPIVLPAHRDPVPVRMRLNEIQIKLIAESRGLAASISFAVPPWQMVGRALVHNASTMPTDTIVTSPSVSARYVAGDPGEPMPTQAPKVVLELEQASTSPLRGMLSVNSGICVMSGSRCSTSRAVEA